MNDQAYIKITKILSNYKDAIECMNQRNGMCSAALFSRFLKRDVELLFQNSSY